MYRTTEMPHNALGAIAGVPWESMSMPEKRTTIARLRKVAAGKYDAFSVEELMQVTLKYSGSGWTAAMAFHHMGATDLLTRGA